MVQVLRPQETEKCVPNTKNCITSRNNTIANSNTIESNSVFSSSELTTSKIMTTNINTVVNRSKLNALQFTMAERNTIVQNREFLGSKSAISNSTIANSYMFVKNRDFPSNKLATNKVATTNSNTVLNNIKVATSNSILDTMEISTSESTANNITTGSYYAPTSIVAVSQAASPNNCMSANNEALKDVCVTSDAVISTSLPAEIFVSSASVSQTNSNITKVTKANTENKIYLKAGFQCDLCEKIYNSGRILASHKRFEHRQCLNCYLTFSTVDQYKAHVATKCIKYSHKGPQKVEKLPAIKLKNCNGSKYCVPEDSYNQNDMRNVSCLREDNLVPEDEDNFMLEEDNLVTIHPVPECQQISPCKVNVEKSLNCVQELAALSKPIRSVKSFESASSGIVAIRVEKTVNIAKKSSEVSDVLSPSSDLSISKPSNNLSCSYSASHSLHQRQAPMSITEALFFCPLCDRAYKYKRSMHTHLRLDHHQCTKCLHIFDTLEECLDHITKCVGALQSIPPKSNCAEPILQEYDNESISVTCDTNETSSSKESLFLLLCVFCGTKCNGKPLLQLHIGKEHSDKKQRNCTFCKKSFPKHISLLRHIVSFHCEAVTDCISQCHVCEQVFPSQRKLTSHQLQKHSIPVPSHAKTFQCHVCSMSFFENYRLKRHMQTVHERVRNICDICGSRQRDLLSHKRIAHEGFRYCCQLCKKEYRSVDKLHAHQIAVHTNQRPYICQHCGLSFSRQSCMAKHCATHFQSPTGTFKDVRKYIKSCKYSRKKKGKSLENIAENTEDRTVITDSKTDDVVSELLLAVDGIIDYENGGEIC